jgi:hypothetical protein
MWEVVQIETKPKKPKRTKQVKRAKIDEIMKHLFSVSKDLLVTMLNSLFYENFDPEQVEVIQTNSEFGDDSFNIIRGDVFFRVTDIADKTAEKPFHYHIEFQTQRDYLIGIRVFEYDFKKAVENERLEKNVRASDEEEIILHMPKSLVIQVEKNDKIPKKFYRVKIIYADENSQEQSATFTVPVVRYWEYDDRRLIDEKLYPLLPLQVFLLRGELEKTSRRKNPQYKRETMIKIKEIAERIVHEAHELGDSGKMNDEDIEKITTAIGELFKHLNDKYQADEKLNEEVSDMIKSLYDENVFIRGREKGKEEGKQEAMKEFESKEKEYAKKIKLLEEKLKKYENV